MKARDGDAQVKTLPNAPVPGAGGRSGGAGGSCPSCGTKVPAKAGFRFSSLKCPKCGTPMGRRR